MEDNQGSCCEKFFRPSRQQESSASRTASNPKNGEAPEAVAIAFDYTSKPQQKDGKLHQIAPGKSAPKQGNGQSEQGKFPKNEQPQGSQEAAGKKTVQHIEDGFTDYIDHAKFKIRTTSNVGEGKSSPVEKNHHGGKESKEHHFLDYIKRAGKMIRTTSNVGEGKSSPVEKNHHGGKDKDHHGGKESKEHHFLDYIKRAGKMIRTTTFKDRTE